MTATKAKNGKTVKDNVKTILIRFPETRDDDKLLFAYYWFMIDKVNLEGNADEFVETFRNSATPPSSIQRQRQILQYESDEMSKYQPTNPNVYMNRKKKEFQQKHYLQK
jgi:hypothetical protein